MYCISAQAASILYSCASQASKQIKRMRSTHAAMITELEASKQVKCKQSTHAAMITELDLLTRFAKVWRRLLEKDDSDTSLLSWWGVPPNPSKLVRMRTLRGVRGVCAAVPPKLPGNVAGATGRSST